MPKSCDVACDEERGREKQTYPMPACDVRVQLEGEALVRRLDVRQARTPARIFIFTHRDETCCFNLYDAYVKPQTSIRNRVEKDCD